MSYRLGNPAAIPPRAERAARGRFISEAAAGDVGAWGWSPGPPGPSSSEILVPIYNVSDTLPVEAFGAMLVTSPSFAGPLADCVAALGPCTPPAECTLGTCGTWPADYADIHASALDYGNQLRGIASNTAPTPANLRDWVVAAEAIATESTGMAYAGGIFYAMVWDPDGLLLNGGELRYVDLPQSLTGYTAATDSDPEISLPLRVRPNGRGRILWYDPTLVVGENEDSWPITKVRLALIERTQHFTYPTIPVTITSATEMAGEDYRWEYSWEALHHSSCTHALVGKAINLAENGNTASIINGIPIAELNDCYGTGGWELQDTAASGQDVLLTVAMDTAGLIAPYFCLQNQIVDA